MSDLVIDASADPTAFERLRAHLPLGARLVRLRTLRARGRIPALLELRSARHDSSTLIVPELRRPTRWLGLVLTALLTRAHERSILAFDGTAIRPLTWRTLAREAAFVMRRAITTRGVVRRTMRGVAALSDAGERLPCRPRRILFLRPDLGPALTGGGSLAHIRGVVGGLERSGCELRLVSPAPVAGFEPGARLRVVAEDPRFHVSVELPLLAYNETFLAGVDSLLDDFRPDAVYLRHALGFWAGAGVARRLGVPLVVEYNGPEVWIGSHWGAVTRLQDVLGEIERRVLKAADLIVAVSAPLLRPLEQAGVDPSRVLVNPNGVDPQRFAPDALRERRATLRRELGLADGVVLACFVGTFGPWHGAEVLARAVARIPRERRPLLHVAWVGDGPRRSAAESIVEEAGVRDLVTFAGTVPFDDIPAWLAASDLCLSPHVPNADGSEFFGSPTKLFEYLASGRAVIASRVGQIGELLEHGRNAWLVPPGDADALAEALVRLCADRTLRERLGTAGREEAIARHSWEAHVARILERLEQPTESSS